MLWDYRSAQYRSPVESMVSSGSWSCWSRHREITTPALRPVASATWRELIKRVWEVDPLLCPRCDAEMVRLAAIRDSSIPRELSEAHNTPECVVPIA